MREWLKRRLKTKKLVDMRTYVALRTFYVKGYGEFGIGINVVNLVLQIATYLAVVGILVSSELYILAGVMFVIACLSFGAFWYWRDWAKCETDWANQFNPWQEDLQKIKEKLDYLEVLIKEQKGK